MRMWRAMRAGLMVVVVVGLAMGGLALAQDADDGGRRHPVPAGAYERILDLLAPLIDDGTITRDQAAAVADRLADSLPDRRRLERRSDRRDHLADVLVDQLGVTPAEIREAAEADQSLADVAGARGVATDELVDRLVEPVEERLGDAVADGHLTEEEAGARLDEARDHVTDRVTRPIRDRRRDR